VFYNLITNSIKYRKPDVPAVVEINGRRIDNGIQIVYKDNGLGMDLKKIGDQVFGLYKRFHANTEGKGMGLFMVKTQIESMGGKIAVKSELGNGCEFIITFKS
jgi:signal transduction histidine kinase